MKNGIGHFEESWQECFRIVGSKVNAEILVGCEVSVWITSDEFCPFTSVWKHLLRSIHITLFWITESKYRAGTVVLTTAPGGTSIPHLATWHLLKIVENFQEWPRASLNGLQTVQMQRWQQSELLGIATSGKARATHLLWETARWKLLLLVVQNSVYLRILKCVNLGLYSQLVQISVLTEIRLRWDPNRPWHTEHVCLWRAK